MINIAIIGSNGYIGKRLYNFYKSKKKYCVYSFTHKKKFHNDILLSEFHEINVNFKYIFFLINSNKNQSFIEIYLKTIILKSKAKLIFFSTFSIYSNYSSKYVSNKKRLEAIVSKYNNHLIFRPGYVYENVNNSNNIVLKKFIKLKYIFLPGYNYATSFISMTSLISKIDFYKDSNKKIINLYDACINFIDFLKLIGIKSYIIKIWMPSFKFLNIFSKLINKIIPQFIQSIFALSAINITDNYSCDTKYFKKIFLYDFFSVYQRVSYKYRITNLMSIRMFYNDIVRTNSIDFYLAMTNKNRFFYHLRIVEYVYYKEYFNNL